MTEFKIRESIQEKESYGMFGIQTLAVYWMLVSVFATYFSVFKIEMKIWMVYMMLLFPVFAVSILLRGRRRRKFKTVLLIAVSVAGLIASNFFSMRGMAPFVNSYIERYNAFYNTSLLLMETGVRKEAVWIFLVGIQILLAVILVLPLRTKKGGILVLLVMMLPTVLAAVVGYFPSWKSSWSLIASGTFYLLVSHQKAVMGMARTMVNAAVILGLIYGCCMVLAPRLEAYREAHRTEYQEVKNTLIEAQRIDLGEKFAEGVGRRSNYSTGGIGKGDLSGTEKHHPTGSTEMEVVLSDCPPSRVYLRAYTGSVYTGSKWKEIENAAFAKVLSPFEGKRQKEELFSMPFQRLAESTSSVKSEKMQIKILNASTEFAYSPYYVKVPDGASVHLDSYIEGKKHTEWEYHFFPQGSE